MEQLRRNLAEIAGMLNDGLLTQPEVALAHELCTTPPRPCRCRHPPFALARAGRRIPPGTQGCHRYYY